jgi:hypothetical protein
MVSATDWARYFIYESPNNLQHFFQPELDIKYQEINYLAAKLTRYILKFVFHSQQAVGNITS